MRTLGLALIVLSLAVACGSSGKDLAEAPEPTASPEEDQGPAAGTAEQATFEATDYPPNDPTGLAELINPLVEPLGLVFTRGSLNDTSAGGYEPSDTGNHLALYVEPIGEYTDEDYINGLYTVAAAATPFVFETFGALTSYDICQEPRPEDDSSPVPPPATQVNIEREAAESYDWENGDLESMLRHAFEVGGDSFAIIVAPPLDSVPLFADLAAEIFPS